MAAARRHRPGLRTHHREPRVRQAAAANPCLPLDLLSALLNDPELAEGAAANPNLSADRLHELLDLCGLPGAATP
ncbi:hypothetical protein [Kitasatospora sp. NPDC098663]|uniref:hypothetical protein n=1 Tax=Kitasatospora sp. NPDC098663 TaxID=3364096 RepID=UPI0037F63CF6